MNYLNKEEIKGLLSVIDNLWDKCLITLGIDLGCRVSEIINIKLTDIDFDKQIIKLWDEKKNKVRICTISKDSKQLIEMLINSRKKQTPLLFNFSYKTANRRVKKWCEKAGIVRNKPGLIRWHMLRHTYCVQSISVGRPIKLICQQTGDTELSILKYYNNFSEEDRVKISEDKPIIPKQKKEGNYEKDEL
ncbi:MAG: site-specific integrase [Nanoarchaeota archaeon]|nr:site-specific integrase [Nanoarchaeota archaeon]